MNSNNVIQFPDINREFESEDILPEPDSEEYLLRKHVSDVAYDLTSGVYNLIENLESLELKPENKDMESSLLFIYEAILAAIARAYDLDHPLHEFSDEYVRDTLL